MSELDEENAANLALRESGVVACCLTLGVKDPRFSCNWFSIHSYLVRDSRNTLIGVTERYKFYDSRDSVINASGLMASEIATVEVPTLVDVGYVIEDALDRGEIHKGDIDRHKTAGLLVLKHIALVDRLAKKLLNKKQLEPVNVREIFLQRPRKYSRAGLPWVIDSTPQPARRMSSNVDVRAMRAAIRELWHSRELSDDARRRLVEFLVCCCQLEDTGERYILSAIRAIMRDHRTHESSGRWLAPTNMTSDLAIVLQSELELVEEFELSRSTVRQAIWLLKDNCNARSRKLIELKKTIKSWHSKGLAAVDLNHRIDLNKGPLQKHEKNRKMRG